MASTSSASAPSENPNSNTNDEGGNKTDEHMYECNICLDTAKDAVISMCGHLFCWPCLHQWLETRPNKKVCPVCKSGISRDKVIPLYGRGSSNQEDPRNKVPPRPSGQRAEAETGSGFGGFGFGDGSFHLSIGIGAFPFNLFISAINNTNSSNPNENLGETDQQPMMSKIFIFIAILMVLWMIYVG